MSELKTKANAASVSAFLEAIPDEQRRRDAKAVAAMMASVTKMAPKMWGTSVVGYGTQHYRYASGREGDWFRTGFSPRKGSLTIYLTSGFERHRALMARLGKYTTGVSCLYLKRLADVDQQVLKQLVADSLLTPLPGAAPLDRTAAAPRRPARAPSKRRASPAGR